MQRKNDVNNINLKIDNIVTHSGGGIRIVWSSDIGYGNYDIQTKEGKIIAHTETMDAQDDKEFIKKLFEIMVEKIQVLS